MAGLFLHECGEGCQLVKLYLKYLKRLSGVLEAMAENVQYLGADGIQILASFELPIQPPLGKELGCSVSQLVGKAPNE